MPSFISSIPRQLALKNFVLFSCILKRDSVTKYFSVATVSLINERCHFELWQNLYRGFFGYFIQHCFICRPSDARMNSGLLRLWHRQPDALTTRLYLIHNRLDGLDHIHSRLDLIHSAISHPQSARPLSHSARSHPLG